jgi:hypothetical protein
MKTRVKATATAIDFKLHFTGLCAFVPYKDAQGITRMRVALVDAESPDVLAIAMDDADHTPALLIPDRFLDVMSTTRTATFFFDGRESNYEKKTWLFLLRQEDLAIMGLNEVSIGLGTVTGDACPQNAPYSFSDWIQPMPQGCDQMSTQAFSGFNDVIVHMDLFDGDLSTSDFPYSYKNKNNILKWYFDSDQGTGVLPSKPIAEEITFGKQWNVSSVTIGIGKGTDKVVLKPDQGAIEAWVVNLPLIDILVDRSGWSTAERMKEHHFHHYYRLATNTKDLIPWPDPAQFCPQPAKGVANPRCPPVLFAKVV